MCRLYGFRSNEPTKVECTLVHAQNALLIQSREDEVGREHPDGWGIGYFRDGDPYLEKNASPAFEGLHFSDAAERLYSTGVISHVRLATVGRTQIENCHPFIWGNWIFAHNGTVAGIDSLRNELLGEISRKLAQNIKGSTDSELLFHWLVQKASEQGLMDGDGCIDLEGLSWVVSQSIGELDRRCQQVSPNKPAKLNTILTDGHVMIASRLRNSLCYVQRDGIRDCEICGIPHVAHDPDVPYHAVVVASEPLSHEAWQLLPDAHVLSVDSAMVTRTLPIPNGAPARKHAWSAVGRDDAKSDQQTADRIALQLRHRYSELAIEPEFEDLQCQSCDPAPALHVDDLSEIPNLATPEHAFYQERARLRGLAGDWLATALPEVPGYQAYCRDMLDLPPLHWLTPDTQGQPIHLAEACWRDRRTRRTLVHAIRSNELRFVHPHMGSEAVWQLALLLSQASHRTVQVIAPPPSICRFANDKGRFTQLVRAALGTRSIPPGHVVWNRAMASRELQMLARTDAKTVAIKLPDAAGGEGNLVIPMDELRGKTLRQIDETLSERLPQIHYVEGSELLVTRWSESVLAAPSAQFWIPPRGHGRPILDGLFLQTFGSERGHFDGCLPADLPDQLACKMSRQSMLIALVYQALGYVGRCSFDMILVGESLDESGLKFIECNGRWGGTSLPMAMMDAVFGHWKSRPFVTRVIRIPGISRLPFSEVLGAIGDRLYRVDRDTGDHLVFNPQRMLTSDQLSLITLSDSPAAADLAITEAIERIERRLMSDEFGASSQNSIQINANGG
ncbi:MAG: class II glutamine amidotransferase [Planctomycetota bacterium]